MCDGSASSWGARPCASWRPTPQSEHMPQLAAEAKHFGPCMHALKSIQAQQAQGKPCWPGARVLMQPSLPRPAAPAGLPPPPARCALSYRTCSRPPSSGWASLTGEQARLMVWPAGMCSVCSFLQGRAAALNNTQHRNLCDAAPALSSCDAACTWAPPAHPTAWRRWWPCCGPREASSWCRCAPACHFCGVSACTSCSGAAPL